MIKPHGSDTLNPLYVADDAKRAALQKEAEGLPKLLVCSQAAANAVMLGSGYFNPLTGFMNLKDALSVADNMKTTAGLFWPVPIVNVVEDASKIKGAKRIALLDPNVDGNPVLAIQDVESIDEATDDQMKMMSEKIFATTDTEHPGVKNWMARATRYPSSLPPRASEHRPSDWSRPRARRSAWSTRWASTSARRARGRTC